ncbi:hypothetical protein FACS189428_1500 [Clostridia bacterium]|nr:hypothetical protein FACS189428_1500 [Clostridia bacterium]
MKKLLASFLGMLVIYGGLLFAQSLPQNSEEIPDEEALICEEMFTLNGPDITYLGETSEYSLSSLPAPDQANSVPFTYTLTLKNGDKTLQTTKNAPLQITLEKTGNLLLSATVKKGECDYTLEKNLTVYQNSLVYLGEDEDAFKLNYDQNFAEEGTYFLKILLPRNSTEEELKILLRKEIYHLNHAENIIIKYANFDQVLHIYIELFDQELLTHKEKNLFVVSTSNQSFVNRVLSLFIKDLSPQKIATVKSSDFLNFLTALSLHKGEEEINSFASFHNLQTEDGAGYLFLSYFIDEAITQGISLQILGTLLIITLLVLLISTLRQLIGLSVFGVYQPLLLAIVLFLIGRKATFFFFAIAVLATLLVRLFSKKINLLQSTKVSLLICLYVILLLIGFRTDQKFSLNLFTKTLRTNGLIVLPIFLMSMVSDKLFTESFKITKKATRIALLEFALITFLSRWMLTTQMFRIFLLSYPEILLAILLAIIIVGRFT